MYCLPFFLVLFFSVLLLSWGRLFFGETFHINQKYFIAIEKYGYRTADKKFRYILSEWSDFQSSCVQTTIWMHRMDSNTMHREKTRWKLHENARCCLEQIISATSYKPFKLKKQRRKPIIFHSSKNNSFLNWQPQSVTTYCGILYLMSMYSLILQLLIIL